MVVAPPDTSISSRIRPSDAEWTCHDEAKSTDPRSVPMTVRHAEVDVAEAPTLMVGRLPVATLGLVDARVAS